MGELLIRFRDADLPETEAGMEALESELSRRVQRSITAPTGDYFGCLSEASVEIEIHTSRRLVRPGSNGESAPTVD